MRSYNEEHLMEFLYDLQRERNKELTHYRILMYANPDVIEIIRCKEDVYIEHSGEKVFSKGKYYPLSKYQETINDDGDTLGVGSKDGVFFMDYFEEVDL